ncbi:hypothetical protein FDG50_06345 [Clostridium botulinum]|uniref:tyrosine-type recombinase/integrase n=1 Tax=Clostridium TaxID=1485 RepID=UPI000CF64D94|nr:MULTISPECIES: tyrosine-type recombinase/integrase [Clostridium]MBY6837386.1 tyrosine-type recombinase/integrase [Clostridium botulinum]NFG65814.1 hypothetical protein [Clostridium botulinum]NFQ23756.1 hypothetical protein [Clostridium botulinum]NFT91632.1 hypothetical protein [Clostridium botulinum]
MIVEKKLTQTGVGVKENIIFSINDKEKYINRFFEAKELKFIHEDSNFNDKKWIYRKGGVLHNITFLSEFELERSCKKNKLNITAENLNLAFRYYMLELICKYASVTIDNACSIIKKTLLNPSSAGKVLKKSYLNRANYYLNIIEFLEFTMLDLINESVIDTMINLDVKKKYGIKKIPNFLSIFDFIDIINHFFIHANNNDLKRYYPIVLWWKISSIIPLRPSELLVTEYNCLFKQSGKYYMKIRRSKGKPGDVELGEGATIESYYYSDIIEITIDIYNFIDDYRFFLKDQIDDSKIELLFSKKLYLQLRFGHADNINKNIITSSELSYLLGEFYTKIVQNIYNKIPYKVENKIDRFKLDQDKYIEELTPYDSRHIAIINLIMLGNEPQTVMKLAGHKQIYTTQGYYNHIEEYTDAYSISFAKKIKKMENNIFKTQNNYSALADLEKVLKKYNYKVNGGICTYSLKDFKPCYKVEGKHSKCPYFISESNYELKNNLKKINKELKNEIEVLKDIVNNKKSISNFSERYSIITESISKKVLDKAIITTKL